jgi:hypothetical protein
VDPIERNLRCLRLCDNVVFCRRYLEQDASYRFGGNAKGCSVEPIAGANVGDWRGRPAPTPYRLELADTLPSLAVRQRTIRQSQLGQALQACRACQGAVDTKPWCEPNLYLARRDAVSGERAKQLTKKLPDGTAESSVPPRPQFPLEVAPSDDDCCLSRNLRDDVARNASRRGKLESFRGQRRLALKRRRSVQRQEKRVPTAPSRRDRVPALMEIPMQVLDPPGNFLSRGRAAVRSCQVGPPNGRVRGDGSLWNRPVARSIRRRREY